MPIYLHCPKCKNRNSLRARSCKKCGYTFPYQGKKYRVEIKHSGKRISRIVNSLALAREIEVALKADLIRGELNIEKPKQIPSLDEVWAKYLPYAKEKKKSWRTDAYYYKAHIQPKFGSKRLDNITPFDLEKLRIELHKTKTRRGDYFKPATIKHILIIIRRLYNLAIKWGMYHGENPVSKITLPKVDNEVVRYLTPEEQDRLLRTLDNWPCRESACFVRFAMLTGLRRSELFRLKWEDIDFTKKLITIKGPKGGKTVTILFPQRLLRFLKNCV